MDKTISMRKFIIYLLILFIFHPVYSETTTILLQSMSYDNDQYLTLSEATIASKNRMLKGIREEEYTFPKIFRYKVKQGEDIWTIIARTSLNIDTIATLNRLDFIGMVKEGGDVLLPDTLGVFLDRDRYEKAEIAQKYSIEEDNIIREKVILAGNRAKEKQKNIARQILKAAVDRLFSSQLKLPIEKRLRYKATILGIKKTRLYVRLDLPFIELKVYTEDLQQEPAPELIYKNNLLINKKSGKVEYKPGDEITLFVQSYRKDRWRLINQI